MSSDTAGSPRRHPPGSCSSAEVSEKPHLSFRGEWRRRYTRGVQPSAVFFFVVRKQTADALFVATKKKLHSLESVFSLLPASAHRGGKSECGVQSKVKGQQLTIFSLPSAPGRPAQVGVELSRIRSAK